MSYHILYSLVLVERVDGCLFHKPVATTQHVVEWYSYYLLVFRGAYHPPVAWVGVGEWMAAHFAGRGFVDDYHLIFTHAGDLVPSTYILSFRFATSPSSFCVCTKPHTVSYSE